MADDPIGGSGVGGGGGPGLEAAAGESQTPPDAAHDVALAVSDAYPPEAAAATAAAAEQEEQGRLPTRWRRGRGKQQANGRQSQPEEQLEPAAAAAAAAGGLKLPPGVAPVSDFTSVFCAVSAVALTLLATTLPSAGGTHEEEREIHRGLMYYFLCAITVLLFFFKMQSSLEHAAILLALDQLMLVLWLLALVLLPVFLHRVIRYGRGRGSVWDWTLGMIGNSLLLADYCLLAVANLGLDASLCCHPHHKAMVYPRGQAARRRRLRNGAVGFACLILLGLMELFAHSFTREYIVLVPLVLAMEQIWDTWGSRRSHHHHHHDRNKSPSPVPTRLEEGGESGATSSSLQQQEAPMMVLAESADRSCDEDDCSRGSNCDSDKEERQGAQQGAQKGAQQGAQEEAARDRSDSIGSVGSKPPQPPLQPPIALRLASSHLQPPSALRVASSQPPPSGPTALLIEPSGLSVVSAAAIRTNSIPPRRVHPPPRLVAARAEHLPWWYALRVKRLRELKELFHGVTGTGLTILGTTLPFMKYDGVDHIGRFSTCLFMYFWAALAVLLYHTRMRQLLSFRRFLFLPEVVLLSIWMILIVLIPKFMEAVALYGRGEGDIGNWTPVQINNTRLLVVHVLIDAVTVHFTASLLYYERKVGVGASSMTTKQEQQHKQPQHRHHRHHHHDSGDHGGAGSTTCSLSLYKLMVIDIAQLALAIILLGVQMTSFFSNQYVYIIPVTMTVSEIYVHFKGGKRESAGPAR